ncbi:HAD family hydrolase [Streptomyces sp. B6B3]|uniref:HAD family hydrolase n=1 Tax=Streptomyces sp. B6B3 TaxID=3153570 RepID=UPI00325EC4AB
MSERIRALVFDFDGLIADTEVLWLAVLTRLYRSQRQELPYDRYLAAVGGTVEDFDPYALLAARGVGPSAAELEEQGLRLFRSWMAHEEPMPGVRRLVAEARRRGLALGVATSSRASHVLPYLRQFSLHDAFATVVTADDVTRTKPAPDLYLRAARRLGVAPASVVAFEDSSRGVRAAKAAGTFCVAVPHVLSRSHDFDGADLRLDSLSLCDVDDLVELVSATP